MTSYDKVVKLACKPKAAPPKAKYLDPIIAATWSEDGAVHDVCKALSPRFREPNAIIVFKALIVLHTMIRNGATDNVLSYLSSSEVLRLQNVSAGNWEGYNAPQNMQNYAIYLDSRIRAYRELKHDAVRVQAESNRDLRNSNSIEEDGYLDRGRTGAGSSTNGKGSSGGPQRSKTIMGRKLRVMTVEKGLLRETKVVHKMIDALVECRFYLDDLEDELTTTALRMLVKDLLILFQAGNEGVINVLEHYFEMSHIDATQALQIYRHFCKQTERVVEFLGVAKKLQNLLNVPIPNLKHAPVSLAGALQEYLEDPNFEQNRIEYKANKDAAEKNAKGGRSKSRTKQQNQSSSSKTETALPLPTQNPEVSASTSTPASAPKVDTKPDFFTSIEEEQPTMFNPQTDSPTTNYFRGQAGINPFVQSQTMTGQPFSTSPFGVQAPQMQPQPTGFVLPQQTAFQQTNPFGLNPQQQQPPFQPQHGLSPFAQLQPPQGQSQNGGLLQAQPRMLQPQPTGSNPFRQSMMFPQSTGIGLFGAGPPAGGALSPPGQPRSAGPPSGFSLASTSSAFSPSSSLETAFSPFSQQQQATRAFVPPPRPASTPLTSFNSSSQPRSASPPVAQPVKTHQTGTNNPFGPVITPAPPVPKPPTLMELAMGIGINNNGNATQINGSNPQQSQQPWSGAFGNANANNNGNATGQFDMASVAASFIPKAGENKSGPNSLSSSLPLLNSQNTATTTSGSLFSDSMFSSSTLSSQLTGVTTVSSPSAPSVSVSPSLNPQTTGFGGMKAFKPSSSFGASLLESLPPIPGSGPGTPAITGNPTLTSPFSATHPGGTGFDAQKTGFPGLSAQPSALGNAGAQPRSTLGVGLRPQMTGGVSNPFRASMMMGGGGPNFGAAGQSAYFNSTTLPTSNAGTNVPNGMNGSTPSFGANLFGAGPNGAFGSAFNPAGAQDPSKQNGFASLI